VTTGQVPPGPGPPSIQGFAKKLSDSPSKKKALEAALLRQKAASPVKKHKFSPRRVDKMERRAFDSELASLVKCRNRVSDRPTNEGPADGRPEPGLGYTMPGLAQRKRLWSEMDDGSNYGNKLSLLELQKLVVQLWPHFNHAPALTRAHRAVLVDVDAGGGCIDRRDFKRLLQYTIYFSELWSVFEAIEGMPGSSPYLTLDEFVASADATGHKLGWAEALREFSKLEVNGGAAVLPFDAFCRWAASRHLVKVDEALFVTVDEYESPAEKRDAAEAAASMSDSLRVLEDNKTRHKKEQQKRATVAAARHKLALKLKMPDHGMRKVAFAKMDTNNCGALSLTQIDKAVLMLWPHFEHRRALLAAYKAADSNNDGYIVRSDFKKLLQYVIYFCKFWDRFSFEAANTQHERARLSMNDFIAAAAHVGHRMGRTEAGREFATMDLSGGGYIIFGEFCRWCAVRHVLSDLPDQANEQMRRQQEVSQQQGQLKKLRAVHMQQKVPQKVRPIPSHPLPPGLLPEP
jgi:Ca2+-binding EF-hand superfamily protein